MKPASRKSKSLIDRKLSVEARDMFFAAAEKMNLDEAAALLEREFDVKLSAKSVGLWLGERRTQAAIASRDAQFQTRLLEIAASSKNAQELRDLLGKLDVLTEANLALLSESFMAAQLKGDAKEIKNLAFLFSAVLDATAKSRRADAAVQDSITSRDKFQFDAAKACLKHAKELYQISCSTGTENEKLEAAVGLVFGQKPAGLVTKPPEAQS